MVCAVGLIVAACGGGASETRASSESTTAPSFVSTTNFAGQDLSGESMAGEDLRNANFHGANLTSVDFTGADLSGADLSGAVLTSSDFTNANLARVNFERVTFDVPPILIGATGLDDSSLATMLDVTPSNLAQALAERNLMLEQADAGWADRANAACAGTPDPMAGTDLSDTSFRPFYPVDIDAASDPAGPQRPSTNLLPDHVNAGAERFTALVLCVDQPAYDHLGTCSYYDPVGDMEVVAEHLPVRVVDARTGQVIAERTFDGDPTLGSCPPTIGYTGNGPTDHHIGHWADDDAVRAFVASLAGSIG